MKVGDRVRVFSSTSTPSQWGGKEGSVVCAAEPNHVRVEFSLGYRWWFLRGDLELVVPAPPRTSRAKHRAEMREFWRRQPAA